MPLQEAGETYKPEGLVAKIANFVCCHNELCQDCCQSCIEFATFDQPKVKRLSKSDIQHVINHQPVSHVESPVSHASSINSALNSPGFHPSAFPRERIDSENSSGSRTSSRKGSTSSNSDHRRTNPTPVIDMKPIEFWAANKETVQPRTPRRRLPSESEISIEDLKPDLYETPVVDPEESLTDEQKLSRFKLGQVHFSLHYDVPTNTLMVKLMEARDLPLPYSQDANRQDMAHSNPYAKVTLLPDHKDSQQTAVQRKTQNPVWGEVFRFELPFQESQKRTIEIVVKDFDKYSRHCIIGQVHLPLGELNTIKGGHMWKPLLPTNKEHTDLGEILLSLNYLPSAGRLNVDVMKAKQLLQTDLIGGSDPYVRVTLYQDDRSVKSRKTTVKKNTIDPVFNESFSFNVIPEQLSQCSLSVAAWDYNSKSRDDFVGRIVIGKCASGRFEAAHWNRMLHCQRSPVAQWHTLRSREECEEKCPLTGQI